MEFADLLIKSLGNGHFNHCCLNFVVFHRTLLLVSV